MRAVLLGVALLLTAAAPAAAAPQLVKLGDFDHPVYVTSPPRDSHVFVVEKPGRIKVVGGGTFLDIASLVNGTDEERGLLSMAFSPDYPSNGLFYVFYTAAEPAGEIRVVEYKRSANPLQADPRSARTIFRTAHSAANHNGGQLQFGPDGMLYVSIGDNAERDNAKATSNPFGKILRLNPATGGAADGNPYGVVWSYGLRNPWRFSFDRASGDIAIGDVGEGTWEEIDWGAAPGRARGVNFGWPDSEGVGNTGQDPIIEHGHSGDDPFCAIVGGYVVRDSGLPTLRGRYLYGDNCNTSLWTTTPRTGAGGEVKLPLSVAALTSFGEDACGHIYAASLNGPVYRLQDGAVSSCSFNGTPADTTPPGVAVRLTGVRRLLKTRRLGVRVRCSEACQATIRPRLRHVKRLATRRRSLASNTTKTVLLKLSKATVKRLRARVRRRGFVRISVNVRAVDAAGNVTAVTKRGRVKRRHRR